MKLALLFDHFGPYHQARLRAGAEKLEVVGFEFRSRSEDYAWDVDASRKLPIETIQGDGSARVLNSVLESRLNAMRPDVVAIPGWSSVESLTALRWCLRQGVPSVLMSESCSHDERRKPWKEWIKRRMIRLFSAALVGGTAHEQYLVELGMPPRRIFLGYDAVDNDYFRPPSIETKVAEGGPRSQRAKKNFLASARFMKKKNLPGLLRAFANYRQLVSATPSAECWDLVLLGDGSLRPELEALVIELGLLDIVTMPGFKQYPELPGYYARASAFVHASTTEQWGLVVNEAMASGLPVIVSNRCGCAPDLVAEGVNGYTFDPSRVDELAQTLLRLSALPENQRKKMGEESQRIIAHWGPERFGQGLDAAASCASRTGPRKPTLTDAFLLSLLLRR